MVYRKSGLEQAIQTMKNPITANLEDDECSPESNNRALKLTKETGYKMTPFELHHGRKPRTELTDFKRDGESI